MKIDLPNKLYFKIGEVARLAETAPHVIRYWESEFEQIKPKRANSKQRLFRKEDVILILKIKDMLHNQGYTISGAKKILENGSDSSPEKPYAHIEPKATVESSSALKEIKSELLEIQQLLKK